MPASLLEPVFEIICFGTGAVILKAVSFGRIGFNTDPDFKLPWYGAGKDESGQFLLDPNYATLTGIVFWLASVVTIFSFLY